MIETRNGGDYDAGYTGRDSFAGCFNGRRDGGFDLEKVMCVK